MRIHWYGYTVSMLFCAFFIFLGCSANDSSLVLPSGSLLVTFRGGEKCILRQWDLEYRADYEKETHSTFGNMGEYMYVERENVVNEKILPALYLDNAESGSVELSLDEIEEIRFYYKPFSKEMNDPFIYIKEAEIRMSSGEHHSFTPNEKMLFQPQKGRDWDMDGRIPQIINIENYTFEGCDMPQMNEYIPLSSPFWRNPANAMIRIEFIS